MKRGSVLLCLCFLGRVMVHERMESSGMSERGVQRWQVAVFVSFFEVLSLFGPKRMESISNMIFLLLRKVVLVLPRMQYSQSPRTC